MRQKFGTLVSIFSILVTAFIPCSLTAAQAAAPPSLKEQLQAQYKFVKMGSDSNGPTVIEEGTVLAIQKGGILGVPWSAMKACAAKYENTTLTPPGTVCTQGRGQSVKRGFGMIKGHIPGGSAVPDSKTNSDTHYFKKGDKVYPSSLTVDLKNEKINFGVVACDTCNKTDPPTYFKSEVDFQFPAGYLEKADVSKVEDTLAEVLSIDNSSSGTDNQQSGGQQDQSGAQQGQPTSQTDQQAGGQQAPAPAAPPQIQLGQTTDEVVAALGQPEKIVDLGSKKIYVYKDLKITFVNGKVSDVQ
jgi:hypothetical protein